MLAAGVLKSATLRGPAQSHAGPATARGSRTDHKPASRCQAHTQSGLVSPETAHVLRCDRGPLCGTCDTVDPVQGLQHPWDSGFPLGARKRETRKEDLCLVQIRPPAGQTLLHPLNT